MTAATPPEQMHAPVAGSEPADSAAGGEPAGAAARSWLRILAGMLALFAVPLVPWIRAILPIDRTIVLFVPAMAACALVGWWAGGRALPAILWMGAAVYVTVTAGAVAGAFETMSRGWSLLLAGSFGLACLASERRAFFGTALTAVVAALALSLVIGQLGSLSVSHASAAMSGEFSRRNAETMAVLHEVISRNPERWGELSSRSGAAAEAPAEMERLLPRLSSAGTSALPALLALQSLAALALAWAVYHRLSGVPLGRPLAALREFRFNDQLVWALIVGLVFLLLPTLSRWQNVGFNMVVFFSVLYALRGLGVLAWFMAPGALTIALILGFMVLWLPLLGEAAMLAFLSATVAAVTLGLSDTWVDWRVRAAGRPAGT